MTYHVQLLPPANAEVDLAYRWIARRSVERANAWLQGFFGTIQTLDRFPRRCPLAPENDVFRIEIRQLLYGDYRILFTVGDSHVLILYVRHGSQRPLTPADLE